MENRVSNAQMDDLLEYLESHPKMINTVGLTLKSKDAVDREWENLARKLNAHGIGATKTGHRWKKYWIDLKHKVKTRAAAKRQNSKTVSSYEECLSKSDRKVLRILEEYDSQQTDPFFISSAFTYELPQPVLNEGDLPDTSISTLIEHKDMMQTGGEEANTSEQNGSQLQHTHASIQTVQAEVLNIDGLEEIRRASSESIQTEIPNIGITSTVRRPRLRRPVLNFYCRETSKGASKHSLGHRIGTQTG
ncbi:uncharacterized protein LOC113521948 isoform X3 [Galleria mellonella]|uniref:Regulatory protein zeste n=1 Tax=Galleria mellonella TaxID=7137 RepID=A0A6J3C0W4_GALME|nr:uncharacterized protein LOC113521948 isoform X3 [Galleria mellonella]